MKSIGKGTALLIAIVAVLAVGVGTALAAGGPRGLGLGTPMGQHNGAGVMAGGVVMDAAAEYIGITESALIAERHAGKSLAQIATAHGKTVAGLESALVSAFKAQLDTLVSAGRLTDAQAAQALATFKARVGTMVQSTATGPYGRGGGGGGMGLGPCGMGR